MTSAPAPSLLVVAPVAALDGNRQAAGDEHGLPSVAVRAVDEPCERPDAGVVDGLDAAEVESGR